jgi:hypothetical protein
MQFTIPRPDENPICAVCTRIDCRNPCGRLVKWASDQADKSVTAEVIHSANAIKERNEHQEYLMGQTDPRD